MKKPTLMIIETELGDVSAWIAIRHPFWVTEKGKKTTRFEWLKKQLFRRGTAHAMNIAANSATSWYADGKTPCAALDRLLRKKS